MAGDPPIWRVNRHPRFTALEMGEYMAVDDGQRETMRRNLKYERLARTLIYRILNQAVARYLASPTKDQKILAKCRQDLERERDNAAKPQERDNATYAIRSLDVFERSLNALALGGLVLEHAPAYSPHRIDGVKISIQPTVLVRVARPRGDPLRGAIIVDPAKGVDPKSDELKQRATIAMEYTSILLAELVTNTVAVDGEKPSPDHCITFHTYRQQRVSAPTNYRRRLGVMGAACRVAAGMWDRIDAPAGFDPSRAQYRD